MLIRPLREGDAAALAALFHASIREAQNMRAPQSN
jgi:hypothetical protein